MKRLLIFLLWNAPLVPLKTDGQAVHNQVLDNYLQEGLKNNLVLAQQQIGLQKSLLALEAAKSYFLPSSDFAFNYSLAGGGRNISIPVGDLLNPVYQTLNQLTGSGKFPTISNAEENFLPNNFYDARIRTTYPIINPTIRYNRQISQLQVAISEAEIDVYKRALIRDIKTAYYQYLMAHEALGIYQSAKDVVARGLQINESLYRNGKGLPAYISRSRSDVQQVEAQIASALSEKLKAKAYFNFLLNRPLEDSVEIMQEALPLTLQLSQPYDTASVSNREELQQLKTAEYIHRTQLRMQQSFRQPRLNAYLDVGSQAFDFKVNNQSLYYIAGLQVDIPIFHGKRNLIKIEQAQQEVNHTLLQQEQTRHQLQLAAFSSYQDMLTAYQNYKAATQQVVAASAYFKLIDKGRTEGVNTFIEWLDARNQLTQSSIQVQLYKYKALIAYAGYERETSTTILHLK